MFKFSLLNTEDAFGNNYFEFIYESISKFPEFIKTTKNVKGKNEFVVFECIKSCGYNIGTICVIFNVGDYIKIIGH